MLERVLEALDAHRTLDADSLRRLDAGSVGREELARAHAAASRVKHPRVLVRVLYRHVHLDHRTAIRPPRFMRSACTRDSPRGFHIRRHEYEISTLGSPKKFPTTLPAVPTVCSANSQTCEESLKHASCRLALNHDLGGLVHPLVLHVSGAGRTDGSRSAARGRPVVVESPGAARRRAARAEHDRGDRRSPRQLVMRRLSMRPVVHASRSSRCAAR